MLLDDNLAGRLRVGDERVRQDFAQIPQVEAALGDLHVELCDVPVVPHRDLELGLGSFESGR